MSQRIIDADGNEVEVYTADEVEATKAEAKAEAERVQADLAKAQEDLKKYQEKDLNFADLRQQKQAAEDKVANLSKEVDEKMGAMKKEILEGVLVDHYKDTLKTLSGEDTDLLKKVEYHYKRLADTAATKEEVSKKLTDAYFLATKQDDANALNTGVISSGFSQAVRVNNVSKAFTAEEKAMAQKLADAGGLGKLEDSDFK